MIAIINYGIGNLGSVRRALAELRAEPCIVDRPEDLCRASKFILPGVGGFSKGMALLAEGGWIEAIRREVLEQRKPVFGICLGMQLLGTRGDEGEETAGLDLIHGDVVRIDALGCGERIPHVGWNEVHATGAHPLLRGIPDRTDFYFVHSYALRPANPAHVVAETRYGADLTAAVADGPVWGTQFHPEKSSKAGFRVLRNFLEFAGC